MTKVEPKVGDKVVSLITQADVIEGQTYEVLDSDLEKDCVWVRDGVGDSWQLFHWELEAKVDLTTPDKQFSKLNRETQVALFEASLDGHKIKATYPDGARLVSLETYILGFCPSVVYQVIPKTVSGTVQLDQEGKPDFDTWIMTEE